jgi:hypothetical protein
VVVVPDGGLTPRQTGRLTVGRNVTSTSVWLQLSSGGVRKQLSEQITVLQAQTVATFQFT